MPAGDVATTFTVEGSKDVLNALDKQTKAVKDYQKIANPMLQSIAKTSVMSAKKAADAWSSAFDDRIPRGIRDTRGEVLALDKAMENLAASAKKVEEELEDAELTGSLGFTKIGKKVNDLIPKLSESSAKFKSLGKNAQLALAGLAVAGFAAATAAAAVFLASLRRITSELMKGWEQAQDLQSVMAALKNSTLIADTGGSKLSFENAVAEMDELHRNTLFTRREIGLTQAAIARTTKEFKVFARATEVALDVAQGRTDMTPEAAAQWMTTLIGDPSRTGDKSRRAGITFSEDMQKALSRMVEEGKLVEAQMLIIEDVASRFPGQAMSAAQTDVGTAQMVGKEWLDILTESSMVIAHEFRPEVQRMLDGLRDNREVLTDFFEVFVTGATKAANALKPVIDATLSLTSAVKDAQEQQSVNWAVTEALANAGGGIAGGLFGKPIEAAAAGMRFGAGSGSSSPLVQMQIEQAKLSQIRTQGVEIAQQQTEAEEALVKARLKSFLAEQSAQEKLAKRVQVLVQDVESPVERLQRQFALINEAAARNPVTGQAAITNRQRGEITGRLRNRFVEAQEKPWKDAIERMRRQANPLIGITEELENIKKARAEGALSQQEYLLSLEGLRGKLPGKDGSEAFASTQTALSGMYSTIQDAMLKQQSPTVKAISDQTRVLHQDSAALQTTIENLELSARAGGP